MKIDERALEAATEALRIAFTAGNIPADLAEHASRAAVEVYLAALPPAEPGRDRIAVVVGQGFAWGLARFNGEGMDERDWRDMEADAESDGAQGPFARATVRCNLPRPAKPVEVSGTVEGVG